jgi:histidinol dehydrogenase
VRAILDRVQCGGEDGVRELSQQFDGVAREEFLVTEEEFTQAAESIDPVLKDALYRAKKNIETFHRAQQSSTPVDVETQPGVRCWIREVPIQRVGLYVPGGTAPLISTVLMLAVPAQLAGCREVALFTPPRRDGSVHPALLYAASLCGVREVYGIGGAQAVGVMRYGVRGIQPVEKIFGPGNQYVTAAKELVAEEGVSLDMPAGPSEVVVFADHTARPRWVAADLLSQAEHGADSQVFLITPSIEFAAAVSREVEVLLCDLPRSEFARRSLEASAIVVVPEMESALQCINDYAPEHLILNCENARAVSERVQNAGSVFVGAYSPESVGDYASGTNHVLPTGGYARTVSGVGIHSFLKRITFQELTQAGLLELGPVVERLATEEGLEAHRLAVAVRLQSEQG